MELGVHICGTWRPCRLAPDAPQPVEDWLSRFSAALEANHGRLDRALAAMTADEEQTDHDRTGR